MGCLIDTCVWVDVERGAVSPADVASYTGDQPVFISPVSIAELTFGVEICADESIKQRRVSALNRLRKKPVLVMDDVTGDIFGRLSSALTKQGRGSDFRTQDVWLASQAIQHSFALLTRNEKDFHDVPGLKLVLLGSWSSGSNRLSLP